MYQKIYFPWWFVVILLAAFAVGYWAWTESLRDQNSLSLINSDGTVGVKEGVGGVPEGWQTYRNEEYGFEFKYPVNWGMVKENEDVGNGAEFVTILQSTDYQEEENVEILSRSIKNGAQMTIRVHNPSSIKTMSEMIGFWDLGRGGHFKQSEKLITVDGQEALFHVLGDYQIGRIRDVHLIGRGLWIDLTYSYSEGEERDKVFDQILSTFRFVE